ncbi:putative glucose transporter rco-3 OS=Neurospora crassa (strain ATCC 24698 / 74-OR23-1A / CBS 708,71 / DSM 1257 / FGSC 987) GN=rco-3 PE=3 SV=2 [Rhizoctonia solani AG-1 IB]|uniref:Putative glucose transporter rco-3 n=1 Tax=Thanatephorus cucumeris (strain AG1-IB / isolate 7/3/14) TaxID=1108050 RepID=A0A0B7FYE9_THACB|nr:putative glucose transporter rco-3 OS=Neurospora crassa (strain ATCC 24698 / 74-OR23-1A / CBS 708,71 / DSM 1257 / FGSC 987) GN=rco-3 PE=3 SV=2 [Rhizoctonia solani AG-1 IB]
MPLLYLEAYKNHTNRVPPSQAQLLQSSLLSPAFSRQLSMAGGPVAAGGGVGGSGAPKNKFAGILMTTFAAFGGILFGYDTGVISGVKEMENWLQTFGTEGPNGEPEISTSNESLIVSILSAGTFFGALLAAPMGDMLGRKWGLIAACLVFCIGVALQTGTTNVPVFVVGRVFAGLGVGMVSCLVPMYQSECSPKWIRGAVVSCYQWAITIGLLLAAIVNNATRDRPDYTSWRIPIAIQFVWAAILAGGMFLLPESPRYLIKRGRDQDAQKALARLLSLHPEDPEVETELNDIRANLRAEEELGSGSYADCFKQGPNKILTRVMTGIFLQAWQQLTGINFIFYYGTTFFVRSGISNPFLITIATNVVNVGMTVPGIWAVDKVGRRRLLLIGAAEDVHAADPEAIARVTSKVDQEQGLHGLRTTKSRDAHNEKVDVEHK